MLRFCLLRVGGMLLDAYIDICMYTCTFFYYNSYKSKTEDNNEESADHALFRIKSFAAPRKSCNSEKKSAVLSNLLDVVF